MSFPACPVCGAELGPWETLKCLHHDGTPLADGRLDVGPWWTIADLAVIELEREAGVVSIYDIQRAIARDLGREVLAQSLTAIVGADRRFCWSGRGLYGLFRHDRIPGERTLSGVARILLASRGRPMTLADLIFVMKWSGYRFQDVSLDSALRRDAAVYGFRFGHSGPPLWEPVIGLDDVDDGRRRIASAVSIPDPFEVWPGGALLDRWQIKVAEGIEERVRRLDPSKHGRR